jgi:hypothetical protein
VNALLVGPTPEDGVVNPMCPGSRYRLVLPQERHFPIVAVIALVVVQVIFRVCVTQQAQRLAGSGGKCLYVDLSTWPKNRVSGGFLREKTK